MCMQSGLSPHKAYDRVVTLVVDALELLCEGL